MTGNSHPRPTLASLLGKTFVTSMGALRNRGELLVLEMEEERARVLQLILRGIFGLFLAMMTALLLTGTVIFLVPAEYRLYAAAGFTVLYLAGTFWMVLSVRALLQEIPFSETAAQLRKDQQFLEAFE